MSYFDQLSMAPVWRKRVDYYLWWSQMLKRVKHLPTNWTNTIASVSANVSPTQSYERTLAEFIDVNFTN